MSQALFVDADNVRALNAYIFGYAGHSLVTPHTALKQMWWTDDRINAKVTRRFVISQLRGEERGYLDKPLTFGEGLTDDTYMEWILERAKRLFLILSEVGVPDRILGCVDDSWQDDDLPIAREDVHKLELAIENDERLNQKFYELQFQFLLRQLRQNSHIDYGPNEHIPMEWISKLPPAVCLQQWDRIHFPKQPNEMLVRRMFNLTDDGGDGHKRADFLRGIESINMHRHEHIAPVWASYTSKDAGYTITNFVGEHTLRTFMDHRLPPQYARLSVSERRLLLLEWMHCLTDTIASLHNAGTYHGAIRPSNILIDRNNKIAFSDIGHLRTFQSGKKADRNEKADYTAPEFAADTSPKVRVLMSSFKSHDDTSKWSLITPNTSPRSRTSSFSGTLPLQKTSSRSTEPSSPMSFRNFSRHLHFPIRTNSLPAADMPSPDPTPFSGLPSPPMTPTAFMTPPSPFSDFFNPFTRTPTSTLRDLPLHTPQSADIFSLGCIYLDILTFLLKGKLNDYLKFRASHRTTTATKNATSPVTSSRTRPSTPTSISASTSSDTASIFSSAPAFHTDTTRIDVWMDILRRDAYKLHHQTSSSSDEEQDSLLLRGVPALLTLVRTMLVQNPDLRPDAREVKEGIEKVLVGECGVEELCCARCTWDGVRAGSKGVAKGRGVKGFGDGGGRPGVGRRTRSDSASVCTRVASRVDGGVKSGRTARALRLPWKRGPSLKVP